MSGDKITPEMLDTAARAVEKANQRHYADTPEPDVGITFKADIANSKHLASDEAMSRFLDDAVVLPQKGSKVSLGIANTNCTIDVAPYEIWKGRKVFFNPDGTVTWSKA